MIVPATTFYKSSPIKRGKKRRPRRTKAEIETIRTAIYDVLEAENPMTVRQVFYRLVCQHVIGKTENEYNNTVVRQLGLMRRGGEIPFHWIADNTRWMRKPTTYSSAWSMLDRMTRTYRQDLWANQDAYVEIWLEKEALAGVIVEITADWDVPLMVTRGYPSLSFLYSAAETIAAVGKPSYLYYFGDLDPSGLDIPRKVERDIRDFAPDAEIYFERVAVTRDLVEHLDLQTRPTKKTDTRSGSFDGDSVEVDAIEPAFLRGMVAGCIEQHIDRGALERTRMIEKAERETLEMALGRLEDDGQ